MTSSRILWLTLLTAAVGVAVACDRAPERGRVLVAEPAAAAPAPVAEPAATGAAAHAHADEVPPDGRQLFDFMLAKIPELVAKVPCSCCPFMLGQCYHGACPTSCGPCNKIGRKVYNWHQEGVSDDEIISRVTTQHPRKPGR